MSMKRKEPKRPTSRHLLWRIPRGETFTIPQLAWDWEFSFSTIGITVERAIAEGWVERTRETFRGNRRPPARVYKRK